MALHVTDHWLIFKGQMGSIETLTLQRVLGYRCPLSEAYLLQYPCTPLGVNHFPAQTVMTQFMWFPLVSADTETLMCCVYSYHHYCGHTVEWLKGGAEVGGQTAQTSCSSTLTFQTPLTAQDRSSFTCRVGDSGSSDFLLCDVASGSCVKTGESVSVMLTIPSKTPL